MTYLKNAFSHIQNAEKVSNKRLTSVQKNRIALKYVRFRENQQARIMQKLKKNNLRPQNMVDVTGGYDEAIEKYGESKETKTVT